MSRCIATIASALLALVLGACGGSTPSAGSAPAAAKHPGRTVKLTPGGGRGATAPPVATVPALIPPPGAPLRSVHVPVLTFHRVHTMPAVGQPDLIVDPATFAAELGALHAAGFHTIHQWQLFDALYHGAALPSQPIIISVDDGYVDDVKTILPDLQRFGMVATFFVITGRVTEPGFLTAEQIRELDRAGMDVGDHTAHHVDLRLLSPAELQMETAGSKQTLQQVIGHPVYYFAYPFGTYNDSVIAALRAAGFSMAYTTAGGTTESTAAPFTMPRLHVGRSETPSGLVALLGGA
ncbi:MAG: polysaccharide deacetylase family protein [Solirubrobacteraceae bacterium]